MTTFETDHDDVEPVTREIIDLFEKPLGRMVIGTAQLDLALNFLIKELFPLIFQQGLEQHPPKMMGPKISLLGKVFATNPQLVPLRAEAAIMFAEAERLNDFRTSVVHGALTGCRFYPVEALVFTKVDYTKAVKSFQAQRSIVEFPALVQAAYDVSELNGQLHDLCTKLIAAGRDEH